MASAALSALAQWAWPSPPAKAPHRTKMAATYEARASRTRFHTHTHTHARCPCAQLSSSRRTRTCCPRPLTASRVCVRSCPPAQALFSGQPVTGHTPCAAAAVLSDDWVAPRFWDEMLLLKARLVPARVLTPRSAASAAQRSAALFCR
jgi:hypothetical protein